MLLIDIQEASIEPLYAAAGLVMGELESIHFQKMACGGDCVTDSGDVGGRCRHRE